MANDDKIYESYIGNLGEESKNNTNKRINWILNEVKDARDILDVGCSQGIISLLMAKESEKVLGLDIQKEAVDFANTLLKEDFKDVKNNIEFRCINFLDFNENMVFDTIVMTEVLEHLEAPCDFIIHTKKYLKDNGSLVITVPFGVNNHPDHHSTFYLSNIIDIIEKEFQVEKVEYMGRWIGLVAKKCEVINKFNYTNEDVALLEKNFSEIDWSMTRRIEKLYSDNIKVNKKYKESTETYSTLKEKYNNSLEVNNNLKEKYNNSLEVYNNLKENNKKLINEKKELSNIIEKLLSDLNDEISILKENKALINKLETQKNYLKHENNEHRRKLSLIIDTFIGKIGIRVYKMLKKLKAKLK
ncbi:MAG: methyltransferase domain-containing protein [Clostridium sp.]|uniref:methyltransferase n=1 Tax=Clostridium sp. TaxID=1506 RepID=UPI0025C5DCC3|nr:methyltransferase domain-containing protein [Clostridium sp.]MCE5219848.1 methyltransferase domain-containing protein [Clostridium sp.]